MFNKNEFEEFVAEITYLNESTKSLIEQIKEADAKSIYLKEVLGQLKSISNSLNLHIEKVIDENLDKELKRIFDHKVKEIVESIEVLKNISISTSQSIEFVNSANKKLAKREKYKIIESLLYILFFISGMALQAYFHIIHL